MGPVLIFDKSFLESLTVNESLWLDIFFLCNITPLFYVETLADLEKSFKKGKVPRSSQDIVREIAEKTPVMNPCPSMHHHRIVMGELLGQKVDVTNRRIQTSGGTYVRYSDGSLGVDFKQFPEDAALVRWKAGQFEEIERNVAKDWRDALSNLNFEKFISRIKAEVSFDTPVRDLQTLKVFVDGLVKAKYKGFIHFALDMLEIPEKLRKKIIDRWQRNSWQTFEDFSPYASHVLKVDLFFFTGLSKGLTGRERASSNKIDISYLYYLPFTHVFVSNDRLHKRIAPLFIGSDQSFVVGEELKSDFRKINEYYANLPQEIKDLGPYGFAQYPPIKVDTLVGRLHDKNLIPWRDKAKNFKPGLPKQDPELIKKLKDRKKTQEVYLGPPIGSDEVDSMIVTRKVPVVRGDWNIMPKGYKEKK